MAVAPVLTTLGKGGAALKVSTVSYGCMGLTAFYGDLTPEAEALKVLRKAYDLGVRHFDTAQVYAREVDGKWHFNEELVGKFLKTLTPEEKKDVSVATKFNPMFQRYTGGGSDLKFDEAVFRDATMKSLQRLGVKSLDLYYFHRIYPEKVSPVSEWMGAAKKLVDEGLVKRIGLSEASAKVIRQANAIHPITCVQQEWSLFARDLEKDIVPTCKELGIGIISYSPLGRGFLAGRFDKEKPSDWRKSVPYLSDENFDKNVKLLDQMKQMASQKNCTLGQLCIAWVMAMGSVPIPGTTNIKHLEGNMKANQVKLTPEEIKKLGDLGNQVEGERGNEQYMKASFQVHL